VDSAKRYLKIGRIGVFQKINFNHPHLPGLGPIGGSLDFLISKTAGAINLERGDNMVRHVTRYLFVVEAKQESTLKKSSPQIQLITQMITLEYHDPLKAPIKKPRLTIRTSHGRAGCISDRRSWDFYYLRKATFKERMGELGDMNCLFIRYVC